MIRSASGAGAALATAIAVESARRASSCQVGSTEEAVFRAINSASDRLSAPAWVTMQAGSLGAVFVVAAGLSERGRRQTAVAALLAGTSVWAGVKLVKRFVGRGRPEDLLEQVTVRGARQSGLGYPSGHAAVVLALALVAGRELGLGGRVAASVLVGLTSTARVYVGAHLPLDVAGGAAIGALGARVVRVALAGRGH